MSLTASVIIVLVLFVRLLLRRAPRAFSYGLWAVVLFRLLCPVSLSAEFSVLELVDLQSVRAASPRPQRFRRTRFRPRPTYFSGRKRSPSRNRSRWTLWR